MQKLLFFSLLLLTTSAKPMERLKPEDRATAQDRIKGIYYVLGHIGSKTFAGAQTPNSFVSSQARELESILDKNNIEVPAEKNFDWLEALRKKLSANGE